MRASAFRVFSRLLAAAACWTAASTASYAQVSVVNMIPPALSAESNQDSEPNIAVNPSNVNLIAGSAFTSGEGFCGSGLSPLFFSTNGGSNWAVNCIVPSDDSLSGTGDITLRFASTGNTLYGGILARPGNLKLRLLRTDNVIVPVPMQILAERTQVDQPYVQAITIGGQDRVYVGNNDIALAPGKTATIDQALDAAIDPQPFGPPQRIEERNTVERDLPPVRPAVHPDGTVYAAFYGWRSQQGSLLVSDVVVVRDDDGGAGTNPYSDLIDTDNLAGRRVVTNRAVPFENFIHNAFGQERLVASNLSIAVDPQNSSTVYVAWADRVGTEVQTLHVRRSFNRGQSWSGDLRIITNATNPALAINDRGVVGFLYQKVSGSGASQRWVTVLERTTSGFSGIDTLTMATVPAKDPSPQFIPYIGDYVHLQTVGGTFYGIFSANNTPNLANFPQGVTYRRQASFASHKLFNGNGSTEVPVSIDPFFFRVPTNFKLSAPDLIETAPGGTTTPIISIQREPGFTDAVDLALLSPPAGFTATFSPNPTTGSSSTLTLSVASSVPLGTYNVTVRATAGGLTRTANITVAVKRFVLTLSESGVTLFPGEGAQTITVTLTRAPGFTEAVTLSLQLPLGADVGFQFNPTTVTGTTSTLSLAAGRFADPDFFQATVRGTSASATDEEPLGIEIFDIGFP
jgi:hypothetical protein